MKCLAFLLTGFSLLYFSCTNPKENMIDKAYKLYNRENFVASLECFDELIKRDSTNSKFLFKRGNCKGFINNFDESTNDYLKAIKLSEKLIEDSYINLGLNYELQKKDSIALIYYQKADSMNPIFGLAQVHVKRLKNKMKK